MRPPGIQIEEEQSGSALPAVNHGWPRALLLGAGAALLVYLCWRILLPFLPALCWSFALALLAQPVYGWMLRRAFPRNLAAFATVVLTAVVVIVPAIFLARALVHEATGVVTRISTQAEAGTLRGAFENNHWFGPALRWVDSNLDLPTETFQLIRSIAGWISSSVSSVFTGSLWVLGQIGATLFVLFYFLRDGPAMLKKLQTSVLLPAEESGWLFGRIAQTIRVSLGGKVVVATVQGTLGGLMFFWLGISTPVFWGAVMAILSLFPVIGSVLVWGPAAAVLALEGNWPHALILAVWGLVVIHPVDNVLGPILVGSTLHLHTLVMFFSVIGGLAAFGASGVVLGPVILALVAGLVELQERRRARTLVHE